MQRLPECGFRAADFSPGKVVKKGRKCHKGEGQIKLRRPEEAISGTRTKDANRGTKNRNRKRYDLTRNRERERGLSSDHYTRWTPRVSLYLKRSKAGEMVAKAEKRYRDRRTV